MTAIINSILMTQNQYESLKKSFYSILEKEIIVNHRRVNINDESNFRSSFSKNNLTIGVEILIINCIK